MAKLILVIGDEQGWHCCTSLFPLPPEERRGIITPIDAGCYYNCLISALASPPPISRMPTVRRP